MFSTDVHFVPLQAAHEAGAGDTTEHTMQQDGDNARQVSREEAPPEAWRAQGMKG